MTHRIRLLLVVVLGILALAAPAAVRAQSPFPDGFLPWWHWGKVSTQGSFTLRGAPSSFQTAQGVGSGGGFALRADYVPFTAAKFNQPPVIGALAPLSVPSGSAYVGTLSASDANDDAFTFALATNPVACVQANGQHNTLFGFGTQGTPAASTLSSLAAMQYMQQGPLPYFVCASVSDGKALAHAEFAITVQHQLSTPARWGDCNNSGAVNATDVSAIVLEIFDDDGAGVSPVFLSGVPPWLQTPLGAFRGLPEGCNSTRSAVPDDEVVNAADMACTLRIIFDNACEAALVAAQTPAQLHVGVAQAAGEAGRVTLPVRIESHGNALSALVFAIALPPDLVFDATDANGDAIPDALVFDVADGVQRWVQYDAATHRLQIALLDGRVSVPGSGAAIDGALLRVTFVGDVSHAAGVQVMQASAGSVIGANVAVDVMHQIVEVDELPAEPDHMMPDTAGGFVQYLPAVSGMGANQE